jgi:transposase-like protein
MAKDTDWEKIEKLYQLGQLSVREIGRQHGVSASTITRRAEKKGLARDCTDEVRRQTQAALISSPEHHTPSPEDIAVAAHTNAEIIRSHRADIARSRSIVVRLFDELAEQTQGNENLIQASAQLVAAGAIDDRQASSIARAVSLPSRSAVVRDLSSALKNLIPLERQAYNLDEAKPTDDDPITQIVLELQGTAYMPPSLLRHVEQKTTG